MTASRELLSNGKVRDTIYWTPNPVSDEVTGYETRRTTDEGRSWWTSNGYVDDPNRLTWNSKDDAGQEWRNIRRGFQVRYAYGRELYGPWSEIFYLTPVIPDTRQVPTITALREVLSNGKVNDTLIWDRPDNSTGLAGYDIRRTTDGGQTWWTSNGYVDDPAVLTWNAVDDADGPWRNIRRGFQVRYDFGAAGFGPWSDAFYIE